MGPKEVSSKPQKTAHGIIVELGSFTLGQEPEGSAPTIEKAYQVIVEDALKYPEYEELERTVQLFLKTRESIKEELTRITLRRVIPGKCDFCPF